MLEVILDYLINLRPASFVLSQKQTHKTSKINLKKKNPPPLKDVAWKPQCKHKQKGRVKKSKRYIYVKRMESTVTERETFAS